jgi:hypothetical protein
VATSLVNQPFTAIVVNGVSNSRRNLRSVEDFFFVSSLPSVTFDYTVTFTTEGSTSAQVQTTYTSMSTQLNVAISNGNFQSALIIEAQAYNAPALTYATATQTAVVDQPVIISVSTFSPTSSPGNSPSKLGGGAVAAIVISVLVFVGACLGGGYYYFVVMPNSDSSRSTFAEWTTGGAGNVTVSENEARQAGANAAAAAEASGGQSRVNPAFGQQKKDPARTAIPAPRPVSQDAARSPSRESRASGSDLEEVPSNRTDNVSGSNPMKKGSGSGKTTSSGAKLGVRTDAEGSSAAFGSSSPASRAGPTSPSVLSAVRRNPAPRNPRTNAREDEEL